jgi:hypothetical protein
MLDGLAELRRADPPHWSQPKQMQFTEHGDWHPGDPLFIFLATERDVRLYTPGAYHNEGEHSWGQGWAHDSWGHPIRYRCPGPVHRHGWDLWSVGPNGTDEQGEGDDILVGEDVADIGSGE